MAATYRYLVANTVTGVVMEEMSDASDVKFGWLLNRPGSFSASIPKHPSAFDYTTVYPVKSSVFVERDGEIIWGGILWSLDASGKDNKLSVIAEGMWSYPRMRMVPSLDYSAGADVFYIVNSLIDSMQSASHGDLDFEIQLSPTSTRGFNRAPKFYAQENRTYADVIEAFSQSDTQGFDISTSFYWKTNQVIGKRLVFTYPKVGRTLTDTFEYSADGTYGVNITDYKVVVDGKQMANKMYGFGATIDNYTLRSTQTADYISGSGSNEAGGSNLAPFGDMPLLEGVYTRKSERLQTTLDQMTKNNLRQRETPIATLSMQLSPGTDPEPGSFYPGDIARVVIDDTYLQFNEDHRISGVNVNIDAGGQEQATVSSSRYISTS